MVCAIDTFDFVVDRWVTTGPTALPTDPLEGRVPAPTDRLPSVHLRSGGRAVQKWVIRGQGQVHSFSRPSQVPSVPPLSIPVTDRKPGRVARALTSVALLAVV